MLSRIGSTRRAKLTAYGAKDKDVEKAEKFQRIKRSAGGRTEKQVDMAGSRPIARLDRAPRAIGGANSTSAGSPNGGPGSATSPGTGTVADTGPPADVGLGAAVDNMGGLGAFSAPATATAEDDAEAAQGVGNETETGANPGPGFSSPNGLGGPGPGADPGGYATFGALSAPDPAAVAAAEAEENSEGALSGGLAGVGQFGGGMTSAAPSLSGVDVANAMGFGYGAVGPEATTVPSDDDTPGMGLTAAEIASAPAIGYGSEDDPAANGVPGGEGEDASESSGPGDPGGDPGGDGGDGGWSRGGRASRNRRR